MGTLVDTAVWLTPTVIFFIGLYKNLEISQSKKWEFVLGMFFVVGMTIFSYYGMVGVKDYSDYQQGLWSQVIEDCKSLNGTIHTERLGFGGTTNTYCIYDGQKHQIIETTVGYTILEEREKQK